MQFDCNDKESRKFFATLQKVFISVNTPVNPNGDLYINVFSTQEEANEDAELIWSYLTKSERKRRRVYAATASRNDVSEDGINGDEVDWEQLMQWDSFVGSFDSKSESEL